MHSMSVLTNGTNPLRRTFILLLAYLGEGRIFPSSLMSPSVMQQGVNGCTLKDTLGMIYFLLYIFRCLVDSYALFLLVQRRLGASHYYRRPFHIILVTWSSIVTLFYFMLIIYSRRHDLLDGLQFFLRQFCIALDRRHSQEHGRLTFPFDSELFC